MAASAVGSDAAAYRSSISSSVTSRWSKTSVRRNAAIFSRLGPGGAGKSASRLTPSVGSGAKHVEGQPAGSHQHQAARALRVVQGEADRGAAAERVAHQVHPVDAELVEQARERAAANVK